MGSAFYRAGFEKQLTGSHLGGSNCAAASGAMLVDQSTLRLKNPTPDAFRRATGDFSGGLMASQVGSTCERKYGVPVHVFDYDDNLDWPTLKRFLSNGRFAVISGDYEVLPRSMRGDKDFTGDHSVFYHRITSRGVIVGDPLADGRRPGIPKGYQLWPMDIARKYAMRFTQTKPGGIYAVVLDRKRLRARPVSPNTKVRSVPKRGDNVIGSFGGTSTVVYGGTVQGESIGGNSTWFRIWWPKTNGFGYCHSSVVARV